MDSMIEVPSLPLIHLPEILDMIQPMDQERGNSNTEEEFELVEIDDFDLDMLPLKLHSETSNLHGIDNAYHHIQYPTLPGSEAPTITVVHVNDTGGILVKNARPNGDELESSSIEILSFMERETKLVIENGGAGFFIGDFLGINAWEQILFSPNILKQRTDITAHSDEDLNYFKQVLLSSVLVDGSDIYYGVKSGIGSAFVPKRKPNSPLKLFLRGTGGEADMASRSEPQKKLLKVGESNLLDTESTDSIGQHDMVASTGPEMNWQKKIVSSLMAKVDNAVSSRRREMDIERLKQRFLQQSRKVLKDITLCGTDISSDGDVPVCQKTKNCASLDILRIRSLSRPMDEASKSNGLSLQLNIEVDIILPLPSHEMEKGSLHNVHLSCSLGEGQVTNALVKTQSGMVPTLSTGDCVTIMAMIRVIDVIFDEGKEVDDSSGFLVLSLGVLWQDEYENQSNGCGLALKGTVLASMALRSESFLYHQDSTDMQLIEFSDESNDQRECIDSIGVFEYRSPSDVVYNVSNDTNVNLQRKWEERINGLNKRLKGDHQIDLVHDRERMLVNLTIFASSLERREGKYKCIICFHVRRFCHLYL